MNDDDLHLPRCLGNMGKGNDDVMVTDIFEAADPFVDELYTIDSYNLFESTAADFVTVCFDGVLPLRCYPDSDASEDLNFLTSDEFDNVMDKEDDKNMNNGDFYNTKVTKSTIDEEKMIKYKLMVELFDSEIVGTLSGPTLLRLDAILEELERLTTDRGKIDLFGWYKMLIKLDEYKRKKGHCNVPQKYGELGRWVNKQREHEKKGVLSKMKMDALNALNFRWARRKGEACWSGQYDKLYEYYCHYGHANYPTRGGEDQTLGRWVSTQRTEYKKYRNREESMMNDERIKMLSKIGFKWYANRR